MCIEMAYPKRPTQTTQRAPSGCAIRHPGLRKKPEAPEASQDREARHYCGSQDGGREADSAGRPPPARTSLPGVNRPREMSSRLTPHTKSRVLPEPVQGKPRSEPEGLALPGRSRHDVRLVTLVFAALVLQPVYGQCFDQLLKPCSSCLSLYPSALDPWRLIIATLGWPS